MADQEDCEKEIFVMILLEEDGIEDQIPVSLATLEVIEADEATKKAIADWHYWVETN